MNLLIETMPFSLKYATVELKNLLDKDSRIVSDNLLLIETEDVIKDFLSIVLLSRTTKRVLMELVRVPVDDITSVYDISKSVNWDAYISPDLSFAVRAIDQGYSSQPSFPRKEIERLIGQGIVDSFLESIGKRPPVKLSNPDIEIYAFVRDNEIILGLDISGYDLNSNEEILARTLVLETNWNFEAEKFIEILAGNLSQSAWDYAKRIPFRGKAAKLSFIKTKLLDKNKFLRILREEWSRNVKPQITCFERSERLDIIKKDFIDYRLIQIKSLNELEINGGVIASNLIVAEPRKEEEIKILELILNKLKKVDTWQRAVFSVRLDVIDIFKKHFGNDIEEMEEDKESNVIQIKYGPNIKIKGIEGKIVSLLGVDRHG